MGWKCGGWGNLKGGVAICRDCGRHVFCNVHQQCAKCWLKTRKLTRQVVMT